MENTEVVGEQCQPKKRQRKPVQYKRNVAKKNRYSRKAYINRSGNVVDNKTFSDIDCHCRNQYHSKISVDERVALHKQFLVNV